MLEKWGKKMTERDPGEDREIASDEKAEYAERTTKQVEFFDNLMNKHDLARFLRVSIAFINDWLPRGLPHYKLGRSVRFRRSEVQTWLERRHVHG